MTVRLLVRLGECRRYHFLQSIDDHFDILCPRIVGWCDQHVIAADTMTGQKGHRVEAIDHGKLQELLRFHRMLVENHSEAAPRAGQ